ncbi:MAG: hypothetical protein HY820_45570 [Acidobacteria bacterium]|nr:hypothetical protein [Acidobacteriota bacterium]
MEEQLIRYIIPATGLVSGLIATYVSLQNRALLAEVRKELAELENRIIARINGTYVRAGECGLREQLVHERIMALTEDIRSKTAAGGSGRRHGEAGESTE